MSDGVERGELDRIHGLLSELDTKLDDVCLRFASFNAHVTATGRLWELVQHIVLGNGAPPLAQRVAVLEEARQQAYKQEKSRLTLWLSLGAMALTAINGVVTVVLHFIK